MVGFYLSHQIGIGSIKTALSITDNAVIYYVSPDFGTGVSPCFGTEFCPPNPLNWIRTILPLNNY